MKCPKCHYISFENGDRCRNCGYEISLSVDAAALDLPIQTGDEPLGPLGDFSLADLETAPDLVASPAPSPPKPHAAAALELPLFMDRTPDDDRPLVTPSAVPRPPLAVRKGSPIVARPAHRKPVEEPELELDLPEPEPDHAPHPNLTRAADLARPPAVAAAGEPTSATAASLGRRIAAMAIDALLLGLGNLGVLYFTLRLCGVEFAEIELIPPVPFLSFLLMQNGAYFVAFVALGGQTIGKMALHIKVVPDAAEGGWTDRVPLGTSVLRAAAWFLTVLPAGVGLLPALLSEDRRAVHDRLAGTRVVRA